MVSYFQIYIANFANFLNENNLIKHNTIVLKAFLRKYYFWNHCAAFQRAAYQLEDYKNYDYKDYEKDKKIELKFSLSIASSGNKTNNSKKLPGNFFHKKMQMIVSKITILWH